MGASQQSFGGEVALGPGERLLVLARILTPAFGGVRVRALSGVEEIESLASGVLVLDADVIALADLGFVRRALERAPVRVLVTGDDPASRVARTLSRTARARWLAWPPDLDDLEELASGAPEVTERAEHRGANGGGAQARVALEEDAAPERPDRDDDLDAIERVLGVRSRSSAPAAAATPRAPHRADARAPAPSPPPPADALPPSYFRHQVADLADLAQRIDYSLKTLADGAALSVADVGASDARPSDDDWSALGGEVARLVQFTRTLGYLAAPPPPGNQVFDLSEMLEWCVASLVGVAGASPRGLFRSSGPTYVRSDRALLAQAFDAFFYLAQSVAHARDIVRVELASIELDGAAHVRVTIQFAAGPLADLAPEAILVPYALRRVLPELGANALSAAVSIVAGQGGSAALTCPAPGRLEWVLVFPRELEPCAS